jgi:hypothetical protein
MMVIFAGMYLTIASYSAAPFTIIRTNFIAENLLHPASEIFVVLAIHSLVFLFYPVIELLADVQFTCYRLICCSFWIFVSFHFFSLISSVINLSSSKQ